jgi:SAM-dependent methyltransferase
MPMRILDPMSGSGTTVVAARLRGHHAVGYDTDPLAILIARVWSSDVEPERIRRKAREVLVCAMDRYRDLNSGDAYPSKADDETRAFIRFWFDETNRRQLAALSDAISLVKDSKVRSFLWCAFSRLIITKHAGASLAMDVSHSRPHKVYSTGPVKPLKQFLFAIEAVLRGSPFSTGEVLPRATIRQGDARKLPVEDETIDMIITSPPYLNAIDYLRGHKLSLVWMGHQIEEIRSLRSQNVGTECSSRPFLDDHLVEHTLKEMGDTSRLSERIRGMLARYVRDMNAVFAEVSRVLKHRGTAVLVVGNSTIRGVFVQNSRALMYLARENGLTLRSRRRRPLLENRRYLPPPGRRLSGKNLRVRMREEVIMTFEKNQ